MARIGHFGVARQTREDAAESAVIRVVGEIPETVRVSVREIEHLQAELEALGFKYYGYDLQLATDIRDEFLFHLAPVSEETDNQKQKYAYDPNYIGLTFSRLYDIYNPK